MSYEFSEAGKPLPDDVDEILFSRNWSLRVREHRATLEAAYSAMEDIVADTTLTTAEKIERVNQATEIINTTSKLGMGAALLAYGSQARSDEIFGIE